MRSPERPQDVADVPWKRYVAFYERGKTDRLCKCELCSATVLRAGLDFCSTFVEKSKQFCHICVFESILYLNVSLLKYPENS